MATKLDAMPKRRGRNTVHPWETWSDGSVWKIKQGEDFEGGLESMRTQLYGRARSLKRDAEVMVDKDEKSITFRMTPWEHPWDELLDGQQHTLHAADFGTVSTMISKLTARARGQRMTVDVTHQNDNAFTYTAKPKSVEEDEG